MMIKPNIRVMPDFLSKAFIQKVLRNIIELKTKMEKKMKNDWTGTITGIKEALPLSDDRVDLIAGQLVSIRNLKCTIAGQLVSIKNLHSSIAGQDVRIAGQDERIARQDVMPALATFTVDATLPVLLALATFSVDPTPPVLLALATFTAPLTFLTVFDALPVLAATVLVLP